MVQAKLRGTQSRRTASARESSAPRSPSQPTLGSSWSSREHTGRPTGPYQATPLWEKRCRPILQIGKLKFSGIKWPAFISQKRILKRLEPRCLGECSPHSALSEDTDMAHSCQETLHFPNSLWHLWHRPIVLKAWYPDLQHQVRHVSPTPHQIYSVWDNRWAHRSVWL